MRTSVILCAVLACAVAAPSPRAECPPIIRRAEWGAQPPLLTTPMYLPPPTWTIIHHSEGAGCDSVDTCSARMRTLQQIDFLDGKMDIQYNWLVGEDGNVYEGRGWDNAGEHTVVPNYNQVSIGIAFIGTFETTAPNAAALDAAQQLIACGLTLNKIRFDYVLKGHLDLYIDITCPGRALEDVIMTWDHFGK